FKLQYISDVIVCYIHSCTHVPYTTLFRSHVSLRKITAYTPQKKAVSVAVNGQFPTMPQAAVVRNGYTYVPVRGILEQSGATVRRSEEHTSELQSRENLVCRLLLEKKYKYQ